MKLANEGRRPHDLPTGQDGAFFVRGFHLASGASVEVPRWYVEALRARPDTAALFDAHELVATGGADPKPSTDAWSEAPELAPVEPAVSAWPPAAIADTEPAPEPARPAKRRRGSR